MNEDLLSAYLDGELDAAERAAVASHLDASADARAVLDEVRQVRDAVRALPPRDAPAGFWSDVLGDTTVVDLASRRRQPRVRPARWAALAAGAAAAAIVGVTLVPSQDRVEPAVATFTDAHAVRSSVGNDAVSTLAGSTVADGVGR